MKRKIVHVQLLPLKTGVQNVTLDELLSLDNHSYDKYIICKSEGPLTEVAKIEGIKCIYIPSLCREISFINDLKSFFSLLKIFKEYKFDIIHTHSSKTGFLGRIAARLTNSPLIVHTVHGFAFDSCKSKYKRNFYLALEYIGALSGDINICLHEDDQRILLNKLRIKKEKIKIIPNGVSIDKYRPLSVQKRNIIRKELNVSDDEVLFGMVGRLWEQKNPKLLIKSANIILQKYPNSKFIFIGDGELRRELELLSEFPNNIIFYGWSDNVNELLGSLDVFILPSLWEGMPLAILEAQSTGLPCIVSNISGNSSLVNDDFDGYRFISNDSESLVEKIELFILDNSLISKLGNNAREKIVNHFTLEKRIENIKKIYEKN